ncbi:glycosyltransferase family 2 protein [Spirosoma litoris]
MEYLKISIITPSYNQGQYLERTIQSVLNQNYPNLEYLIIDGGSSDNSVDIIKKYSKHISYWVSEKDKGQSDAINKGLSLVTGEIIGWINSDDVLIAGSLAYINNYFQTNRNVELLNGSVIEIDKEDKCLKIIYGIFSKWFTSHGSYNILQPSMVWRKSVLKKIGLLNNDYHACMDLEFLIRAYENNISIRQTTASIGAIRIYDATKTASGGQIWIDDENRIAKVYGKNYLRRKNTVYYLLYGFCKFMKGDYLRMLYFKIQYKGESISKVSC